MCLYFKDMEPVKTTNKLLDIMGYLFENGADPTVKSKNKTPRDIATKNGFKLGAALLGNIATDWVLNYDVYIL